MQPSRVATEGFVRGSAPSGPPCGEIGVTVRTPSSAETSQSPVAIELRVTSAPRCPLPNGLSMASSCAAAPTNAPLLISCLRAEPSAVTFTR